MRKFSILGLTFLTAVLMCSCGLGKMVTKYPEVSVTLENQDLENKGGEVAYTIKGTIPPKYMKKKATMTFSPSLKVDGVNTQPFTTIKVKGEKATGEGTTIKYKTGGTFTHTGTFKFDESYEMAEIVAPATAQMKKKSASLSPEKVLGEGVANTSSRINLQPIISEDATQGGNFINLKHRFTPEFKGRTAIIYFDLNSSAMNWGNKNNKSQAAKDSIEQFLSFLNEGKIIDRVVISGWASPEGEETNNQGLSERRFEQGKKWFEEKYNKYLRAYAKANKIKMKDLQKPVFEYVNNANGEDWAGFEAAVEKSNIAQKNQILNVVKSQPNNEMREQKIREMTDIYPEIADAILPPLRRAEIQLICKKHEPYTNEELVVKVKETPKEFSVNERLFAASVATVRADQEVIYKALMNDSETERDERAYNNIAVLYLNDFYQTGNNEALQTAVDYLNKAAAISPNNGVILNNLALAEFLQGNYNEARTHFNNAGEASVEPVNQDYVNGMYSIIDGDYTRAVQLMGSKSCDYNTALVQILNKDYAAAKTTLDCITNVDAKTAYLKAVLAARTKNEAGIYSNLTTAVEKDPSLKKTAKRDAEFKRYRHTDSFKNIVK